MLFHIRLRVTIAGKDNQFNIAKQQMAVVVRTVKIQGVAPMRDTFVSIGTCEQAEIDIREFFLEAHQEHVRAAIIALLDF